MHSKSRNFDNKTSVKPNVRFLLDPDPRGVGNYINKVRVDNGNTRKSLNTPETKKAPDP